MLVAKRRQGYAPAEPILFFQPKDFFNGILPPTFISEAEFDLRRSDVACLQTLYISFQRRTPKRVTVNELAIYLLPIAAEWCCRHVDDLGVGKALKDLLPAVRSAMARFVDDNHVKEIIRKLKQPFLYACSELLNICDDDM